MDIYTSAIESSKAFNLVLKDKKGGRLSHTYLLCSEDMDYIKAFAKQMALIMLERDDPHTILKVEKDIHPDVFIYGEDKINTRLATDIASDVYVRPLEGDYKIYILLNMQDANEEAQNKLLKTIEEPPSCAYFILGTTKEKKLLQTVLSRSKKIELDRLSQQQIAAMLEKAGVKEPERSVSSACANGVFSVAYKMATDKEFMKMYQNIIRCLGNMNSSRDILEYSAIFSSKSLNKEEFADLFMLLVRDLMMIKSGNDKLVYNMSRLSELKVIANTFSLAALQKTIEYCLQLKEDLVYNTNINASIDQFLLKVVEGKVRCKK